jgi:hypothetical protein
MEALVCHALVCPFEVDISLSTQTVGTLGPTVFYFVLCLTVEGGLPRSFFVIGRRSTVMEMWVAESLWNGVS